MLPWQPTPQRESFWGKALKKKHKEEASDPKSWNDWKLLEVKKSKTCHHMTAYIQVKVLIASNTIVSHIFVDKRCLCQWLEKNPELSVPNNVSLSGGACVASLWSVSMGRCPSLAAQDDRDALCCTVCLCCLLWMSGCRSKTSQDEEETVLYTFTLLNLEQECSNLQRRRKRQRQVVIFKYAHLQGLENN